MSASATQGGHNLLETRQIDAFSDLFDSDPSQEF